MMISGYFVSDQILYLILIIIIYMFAIICTEFVSDQILYLILIISIYMFAIICTEEAFFQFSLIHFAR